jgi:hypothetical protein
MLSLPWTGCPSSQIVFRVTIFLYSKIQKKEKSFCWSVLSTRGIVVSLLLGAESEGGMWVNKQLWVVRWEGSEWVPLGLFSLGKSSGCRTGNRIRTPKFITVSNQNSFSLASSLPELFSNHCNTFVIVARLFERLFLQNNGQLVLGCDTSLA